MKKSVFSAVCGVMSALSVVLIVFGGVFTPLSYFMPIASGLLMIIMCSSIGNSGALFVFFSTSVLSLILCADKECALLYVFFFGWYPLVKDKLNKIKKSLLRIPLKFIIFNAAMVLVELVVTFVFKIPWDNSLGKAGLIILIALANLLFFVYEKLIIMLERIYIRKYKSHVDGLFKRG